jgi:MSHA biogenesis protein MshK
MQPPAVQRAATAGPGAPEPGAGLRLQGIRSDGRGRLAVLNGQAVRVGQEVGGAVVTGIGRDSVTLSRDGRSSELKLAGRDVKTVHRRAQ